MDTSLNSILRAISEGLSTPVIVVLLVIMAVTLVLVGSIVAEWLTERRKLKANLPKLVDSMKEKGTNLEDCISKSGLLKRQKAALAEILHHPCINDIMRESLALELLEEEKHRYTKIVKISDMVAKLGPVFGLLGTLIPLGPGIVALGEKDTLTLSQSLLTAFDTTVAGLICAAIAMIISAIRKSWYSKYMTILEACMSCELEVLKDD